MTHDYDAEIYTRARPVEWHLYRDAHTEVAHGRSHWIWLAHVKLAVARLVVRVKDRVEGL